MRFDRQTRRGQVVVLVAVCLAGILGVTALSIDGGALLEQRRRAQAAADAAAMAAATDLYNNYRTANGQDPNGTAKASALAAAAANGYTNDGATSVVTVNIPPVSGIAVGKPGYVEVVAQFNQKRGFSSIFGGSAIPVQARAVARGQWTNFAYGVISLDPHAQGAFCVSGNGPAKVTGGAAIIVDSDSSAALDSSGNGGVSASVISVTGYTHGTGMTPTPTTGATPVPDPLAYLPMPDPAALGLTTQTYSGGTQTLNPGVYPGGITVSGTLTLNPGIYYMQGGSFISSSDFNVTGNGVMIYSDTGNITVSGNGSLNITPLTSGLYQGFSLMLNRNSTGQLQIIASGAGTSIGGTVYGANSFFDLSGDGALNCSQLICRTMISSGNGGLNVNWNGNTSRARFLGLVE